MTRRPWARRISVTAVCVAALAVPAAPAAMAAPAEAATTSTSSAKVDHATWQKDCQAVMDQALPYLKDRIAAARPGEKQAIVFDIDNTTLETDFGFSYPQPANRPVLDVARYAQEHGVSLFFVTARPGVLYWPTEYNLEHDGYDVSGLHVRGLIDLFKDVAAYKTAQRVDIENDGYTIIANIGNSATDLSGGHAEKTFKLPDYDGQLS
ncbi:MULTISPECIES: HAD family acid phosphatase [Streptomyces]|uniref:HAD family acid phosphatase n=1 Tax=Streptomyces flaveolus TaxID=67297 RepID=A0ABV3A7W8_9ACTN|nr:MULTISPECIES: HAD family acid phosphatase [Streptomyces]KMS83539.1 hydrolase [Streptomyces regensis]KOG63903.1 hydrolase [Streptomyces antibioticus]KOV76029.1 hydrolase [Streptomyces sp. NRRL WC-3723]MBG7701750.1 hydrolase [Streptomyces sp. MC1]